MPQEKLANIKQTTTYINVEKTPIYLLNKDNYVIRTTLATSTTDKLAKIKELIKALTIGSENTTNLPKNFEPIIPQNTKLIDLSLNYFKLQTLLVYLQ